ncbi:unnamed protein product [Anisakis simplex]|uniref:Uncharacterized protein n=1 Tax=Anisakis simplex TaxID=6269 RepID=A0A3P6RRU5_ANISI|nr:unnamed protein product [Anisakis simplex]
MFIYLVFDNDPWTGKWSADLQCSFRILSLNGTGDLTGATKTYALSNNNYYIVAGFPVNVIRKKGSGLVTSTDTVRIQADIEWGGVQIVNNYEQVIQECSIAALLY